MSYGIAGLFNAALFITKLLHFILLNSSTFVLLNSYNVMQCHRIGTACNVTIDFMTINFIMLIDFIIKFVRLGTFSRRKKKKNCIYDL